MIWSLAWATMPLPAYDEVVITDAWYAINSLIEAACEPGFGGSGCAEEPLREAIERADTFQKHVTPDARLEYLTGLAHRSLDEVDAAVAHYRSAVKMDAERTDAWHDLGEILLDRRDFEGARVAFQHVADRNTRGRTAWVGPFRLGEVAAHQQKPEAFERHIRTAIQRGFSFRMVLRDTEWRTFARDPVIGPSVSKLVTVYGTPEQLKTLRVE